LNRITLVFIVILLAANSFMELPAQRVYVNSIPLGTSGIDLAEYWYELAYDNNLLDSLEQAPRTRKLPYRFALKEEVSLSPGNSGLLVNKGIEEIWYLPVRSQRARSINIIFNTFRLTEGEMVFIYDSGKELVRGPFTSSNNNIKNVLATLPVPGEEVIIEYHRSRYNPGMLQVGQISHDYTGILNGILTKDQYFGSSGPCNVDINCSLGDEWQVEKRSVVRIFVNGTDLGSGALVNNTNQENIPYLLTADHLINSSFLASRSIFVFGYESAWCDGVDGHVDKSISGSEFIANNSIIDFTLLKLNSFPPITYKPYLAGWSASSLQPQKGTTIHHPGADVKKISLDFNSPVVSTFESMQPGGFWKVLQWEYGTTEGGSSGAPLFDQNHRIVGHLTGGEAVCGQSVNDFFARFDVAYDLSPDLGKSMKGWLDPAQSGLEVLNGRDPYSPNFVLSDTISNNFSGDTLLTKYNLPQAGYTTGFNSDSILSYAEEISYTGTGFITEVFVYGGDTRYILSADSVTFFILESQGGSPGAVVARKAVLIKETQDFYLLSVDFGLPVEINGDFFIAYRVWYKNRASTDSQQFAVCHSPEVSASENTAWYSDDTGWHPFTEHPYSPGGYHLYMSAVLVRESNVNSIDSMLDKSNYLIYPNPFDDNITLSNGTPNGEKVIISLFDINGKLRGKYTRVNDGNILISGLGILEPGIYFIYVAGSGLEDAYKIIKQK